MSKTTELEVNRSTDLVLQEVWTAKDMLSASYGHDVSRLFAEARRRQKLSGHRIIKPRHSDKRSQRKAKSA
ncbi:MAG TPA: hypothetical protein VHZ30_08715 [Verrucomicrobiae bacterium]|nr:hypothetical protein [Verrucomicrobiae bacterium]